jgi:hypothetical protein
VDIPAGAFLATHYHDARSRVETRRIYHDNGKVEAFDGKEWWTVAQLKAPQVAAVKKAIQESGMMDANDLHANDIKDTAVLTYAWHIAGKSGSISNYAYPAKKHPAMTALDRIVDPIVDAMKVDED